MSTETKTTETPTTNDGSPASEPTAAVGTVTDQSGQQQQQPEATQEKTGDGSEASQQAKPEVPEKYELSAAEVTVDSMVTEKFGELAKKHSLSQETAQEIYGELAPFVAKRNAEVLAETQKQWVSQATTDKEIASGDLKANLGLAKSTFDKYGTPELEHLLNASGLGNHPEVIRWALRVAKATGEDRMEGEGRRATQSAPPDPAKILFPNQA